MKWDYMRKSIILVGYHATDAYKMCDNFTQGMFISIDIMIDEGSLLDGMSGRSPSKS